MQSATGGVSVYADGGRHWQQLGRWRAALIWIYVMSLYFIPQILSYNNRRCKYGLIIFILLNPRGSRNQCVNGYWFTVSRLLVYRSNDYLLSWLTGHWFHTYHEYDCTKWKRVWLILYPLLRIGLYLFILFVFEVHVSGCFRSRQEVWIQARSRRPTCSRQYPSKMHATTLIQARSRQDPIKARFRRYPWSRQDPDNILDLMESTTLSQAICRRPHWSRRDPGKIKATTLIQARSTQDPGKIQVTTLIQARSNQVHVFLTFYEILGRSRRLPWSKQDASKIQPKCMHSTTFWQNLGKVHATTLIQARSNPKCLYFITFLQIFARSRRQPWFRQDPRNIPQTYMYFMLF